MPTDGFELAVRRAVEEVSQRGWEGADLRAVVLAAMGHRDDHVVKLSITGKLPVTLMTLLGTLIGATITSYFGG